MRSECIVSMTRIVGSNGVAGRMRQQIAALESDTVRNRSEGVTVSDIFFFCPNSATYGKRQRQSRISVSFLLR